MKLAAAPAGFVNQLPLHLIEALPHGAEPGERPAHHDFHALVAGAGEQPPGARFEIVTTADSGMCHVPGPLLWDISSRAKSGRAQKPSIKKLAEGPGIVWPPPQRRRVEVFAPSLGGGVGFAHSAFSIGRSPRKPDPTALKTLAHARPKPHSVSTEAQTEPPAKIIKQAHEVPPQGLYHMIFLYK